jgi:diguanylate cyclase (GGDEF)-like protein
MRIWLLIPLCVLCVAGSVLFSNETQRTAAATTAAEDATAQRLLADFLNQDRGLGEYLTTGSPSGLADHADGGQRVAEGLREASALSADDAQELTLLGRQRAAVRRWRALADRARAARGAGRRAAALRTAEARDRRIDDFTVANRAYQARLAKVADEENGRAALVGVWLTLGLSALFGGAGGLLFIRASRRQRSDARLRSGQEAVEASFTTTQARFGEALQTTEDGPEAHALLTRHLEAAIPGSRAVALNRNNSADRLEPTVPLDPADPLWEPLQQAKPRSCVAVRLNRPYGRGETSDEILECEICGALPSASVCQPLLVGGEVIGSVLVATAEELTPPDTRRIDTSVTQAAPVLANLRNLAFAEARAATDALTGLPNKRALDDSLKRMAAQAGRTSSPLSVIFCDLDHFKRINDTFGHDRGDEVLAAVGALLRAEVRASDLPGRMGGEEFLVLLPDTDRTGAVEVAEKVRLALHGVKAPELQGPVTASFGVATLPDDAVDVDVLLRIADRALYTAKQNGRDRVECPAEAPLRA